MDVNSAFDQCLPGKSVYLVYMTCVKLFKDDTFRFTDSVLFCTFDRDQAFDYIKTHDNCAFLTSYLKEDFSND